MAAGKLDLEIDQGASFQRTLTLKDSSGTPLNITGWSFKGKIKQTPSSQAVATFTFVVADHAENPGQVSMSLTSSDTSAIRVTPTPDKSPTKFIYDVVAISSGSTAYRIMEGSAFVSPEVSK